MREVRSYTMAMLVFLISMTSLSARSTDSPEDPPLRSSYAPCLKAARGVTLYVNNCIGAEFDFQDKRLNTAYKALRQSLPAAEQIVLRDQERAWIAKRDRECAPRANGGTADMLGSNECRLDYTALRADELEARQPHR